MISNARSIISWTSSGSRRSEMLVNPHTSAKSTVTCLRVHLAPRGAPHSPQNFIPRGLSRPQRLQFPPRSTVSRIDGSEGVPIAISSSRLSRSASMVPDVSNGKIDHDGTELGRFSCAGRGVVPEREFCGECGGRVEAVCPSCQASNPPGQKFCGECGAALAGKPASVEVAPARPTDRFASPESYTPKHLAEKILTSKAAIEGERKIVTVMFSDVSGFAAMSETLDPEDVHAIMDRAFEVILEAVHRYEGTVNH